MKGPTQILNMNEHYNYYHKTYNYMNMPMVYTWGLHQIKPPHHCKTSVCVLDHSEQSECFLAGDGYHRCYPLSSNT